MTRHGLFHPQRPRLSHPSVAHVKIELEYRIQLETYQVLTPVGFFGFYRDRWSGGTDSSAAHHAKMVSTKHLTSAGSSGTLLGMRQLVNILTDTSLGRHYCDRPAEPFMWLQIPAATQPTQLGNAKGAKGG